jgi:hypothetical protein
MPPLDPSLLASLIEILAATWPVSSTNDPLAAAHAALTAMQPRDMLEAMLATRMIATNHAAMDSYRRANQPGVGDADATRLRANAIAAARSFDAAQRILEKRRAAEDKPDKPAQPPRRAAAAPEPPPARDWLAGYTPEEIAAAEYELDNCPAEAARAELAQRIPLHRWEDMTMEERRIAYAAPERTPAQLAVLSARHAGTRYSTPASTAT